MCDFCSTRRVWGLGVVMHVKFFLKNEMSVNLMSASLQSKKMADETGCEQVRAGRANCVSFSLHFSLGSSSSLLWNLQWATGLCEWCPSQAILLICSADLSAERMDRKTKTQHRYEVESLLEILMHLHAFRIQDLAPEFSCKDYIYLPGSVCVSGVVLDISVQTMKS